MSNTMLFKAKTPMAQKNRMVEARMYFGILVIFRNARSPRAWSAIMTKWARKKAMKMP